MLHLEPRQMSELVAKPFRTAIAFLLVSLSLTIACGARELSGAWLSPDWFFPGDRQYREQDVRKIARRTLAQLADDGVDTVFLETFLRGYSICPTIRVSAGGPPSTVAYGQTEASFPVYSHLGWNYRVEFDTVLDPLQIFIEEAQLVGIEVHAWVHMFYWRMDNNDIMLPWHNGPTIWAELMETYLRRQSQRLGLISGRSVRPGYEQLDDSRRGGEIRAELLEQAADLFARGCDTDELSTLLRSGGFKPNGSPMGTLISEIVRAGGERPDFLLMATDQEPFPAPRGKVLRPIYVDPEHPVVRQRLREVVKNIADTHPGLAGIHLDHIRYPVDGQGLRRETGVFDGSYRTFSASDKQELAQYTALNKSLADRREALQTIVSEIRAELPRRLELSAAVLPLYYRDRDNGRFRTSGYDYSSQAWMDWPVDFVVPMLYEYHPYLIRTLVKDFQAQATAANPSKPILVYPGISRLAYTRDGSVDGSQGWVFFDLTLSRDVNVQARETEDLDFGGE
jgi:uncharacterized lipoprotein YddW (UPF0748 family)